MQPGGALMPACLRPAPTSVHRVSSAPAPRHDGAPCSPVRAPERVECGGRPQVRALFAVAGVLQPAVIFIDEIDSILSARKSDGARAAL